MSKVHPAENNKWQKERSQGLDRRDNRDRHDRRQSVLTVWKRSSMSFQGTDGFTVFDELGRLAFRVDNYSRKSSCRKGGLLLMDGAGKALLTLKPQVFSFQHQWNAFEGEEGNRKGPESGKVFVMRNKSTIFHGAADKTTEAEIFLEKTTETRGDREAVNRAPDFRIEGCFWRRSCRIVGGNGDAVANISRKRANDDRVLLGDDVFSLVVQPGFDAQLVMAFVVVLDRICVKPYSPVLCS